MTNFDLDDLDALEARVIDRHHCESMNELSLYFEDMYTALVELRQALATIERVNGVLPKASDVEHRFDGGDNLYVLVGVIRAALDGESE